MILNTKISCSLYILLACSGCGGGGSRRASRAGGDAKIDSPNTVVLKACNNLELSESSSASEYEKRFWAKLVDVDTKVSQYENELARKNAKESFFDHEKRLVCQSVEDLRDISLIDDTRWAAKTQSLVQLSTYLVIRMRRWFAMFPKLAASCHMPEPIELFAFIPTIDLDPVLSRIEKFEKNQVSDSKRNIVIVPWVDPNSLCEVLVDYTRNGPVYKEVALERLDTLGIP